MKKITYLIVAGALVYGTSCSSTDSTTAANTTAETSMSTNASAGDAADTGTMSSGTATDASASGTGTMAGATGTSSGTAGTGTDASMMDATTLANMNDATFMMTSASSNLLEIEAGKLALQHGTHPDVKKFAQMMVDHHTKASKEQMSLASGMQVQLPATLMPIHQEMLDKLKAKTGKDFDEEYMDMMETAHKMDIAMFEAKSKAAETPTVKSFAEKTLPMLKSHQQMATKIEDMVD